MPGNNHIPNLNPPQHISIGTYASFNNVDFLYTAGGVKLQKSIAVGGARSAPTDYLGSIVYPGEASAFIFTPEGRALRNDEGNFDYEYFLRDHLGNTRVSFNQKGTILQDNSYYPFGMGLGEALTYVDNTTSENKYLYNGKEMQDDFGLGWYDYGARFYDAQLGRFHTIDPMAVFTPGISPFSYANDNPITNVDYYGLGIFDWLKKRDKTKRKLRRQNNQRARERKRNMFKYKRGQKYNPHFRHIIPIPLELHRRRLKMSSLSPIIATIGLPEIDNSIQERDMPQGRSTPEYQGNPISIEEPIIFSTPINFEYKSDAYDINATDKTLSDLVQTLIDYPQLVVIICGNAWGSVKEMTNDEQVWEKKSKINGIPSTLGGLAEARAIAIKKYLQGKGISGSRIKAWRGNVYPDKKRGQSTTFELRIGKTN